MANLYEIIKDIENFDFEIDEETGEILNCDALDQLELERDTKMENICLWIKNLKADAEAYKNEAAVFQDKRKKAVKKAESLERYVQTALNGSKFKTDKVTVTYRKSDSVECEDITIVDKEYLRFKEPELDKTKVKAALKQGVEIAGCSLVTKQNMQIK